MYLHRGYKLCEVGIEHPHIDEQHTDPNEGEKTHLSANLVPRLEWERGNEATG